MLRARPAGRVQPLGRGRQLDERAERGAGQECPLQVDAAFVHQRARLVDRDLSADVGAPQVARRASAARRQAAGRARAMQGGCSGDRPERAGVAFQGEPSRLVEGCVHAREFPDDLALRCKIDQARSFSIT
ncbi:hypothetical protein [Sorangium sp. So ce861]|uniref:hypothetical protein n=1 Tax=Sorangium sp. So ce861 TaxID=3133323 RepID=UPI003F6216E3